MSSFLFEGKAMCSTSSVVHFYSSYFKTQQVAGGSFYNHVIYKVNQIRSIFLQISFYKKVKKLK